MAQWLEAAAYDELVARTSIRAECLGHGPRFDMRLRRPELMGPVDPPWLREPG